MFCPNCGNQAPDGANCCPNCGSRLNAQPNFQQAANNVFNSAENGIKDAFNDVRQSFYGAPNQPAPSGGEKLVDNRSLLVYIILTIITCGIYSYYFIYKMAHDVNIACEGDGEKTSGLVAFIVLSFITCGIYSLFWQYGLGNRLASNAPRYGMHFQENGTTVLLWDIFGSLLCGIGSFVAMNILIKNSNKICYAYNRAHGFSA